MRGIQRKSRSSRIPNRHPTRFSFSTDPFYRYTHYLLRFPAKFHPPVARALIEQFSDPGQLILDPFCGSGTLLVEASVLGRHCVGIDIDPLAVFVSRIKAHRVSPSALRRSAALLLDRLVRKQRPCSEYLRRQFNDIAQSTYHRKVSADGLDIPSIPNIFHWFRRYVIIDLAHIHRIITKLRVPQTHRDVFLLCFASSIRAASNADPVPVSGLEVTSHWKKRDRRGRVINPFDLLRRAIERAIPAIEQYYSASSATSTISALQGDATRLRTTFRRAVDVVITSPPYHNAVDYYRRHTLEMYWLRLVTSPAQRIDLKHRYIGQANVRKNSQFVTQQLVPSSLAKRWATKIQRDSPPRADAFLHYINTMRDVFAGLAALLDSGSKAVIVVGKSTWNHQRIPTHRLFAEVASEFFEPPDVCWYPIKNRYMSYARHNGANIDREFVLVFAKK